MTVLLFTYTDWQAKLVPILEKSLNRQNERLTWIGRRSTPIDSANIRGVPYKNPFRPQKSFETDGVLPMLDNPIEFEGAHLSTYVQQMSRYSRGYASRSHQLERFHEYRDHFHLTARKMKRVIEREKISSLLFMNMPHTGDDYLLYRLGESMGLPICILMASPFTNRFFSTASIERFGRLNSSGGGERDPEANLDLLDRQVKAHIQSYMGATYQDEKRSFAEYLFALTALFSKSPGTFLRPSRIGDAVTEIIRLRQGLNSRKRTRREIDQSAKTRKFLGWLSGLSKDTSKLPEKFIYFPMHFQPEMTTLPQGGVFADQALALEMLATRLPDGMQIVAKENPKQGGYQREETFTDRVRQLANVSIVHPTMDREILEQKCSVVATITGTAGWEAIRDERPCICFGHAWYLDCPGVHAFEPDLDVKFVMANPPQRRTSEEFLQKAVAASHRGVIYEFYLKENTPEFEAQNFNSLAETLSALALGNLEPSFA